MMNTKFFVIIILTAVLFSACKKKESELGDLSPQSNIFAPENNTQFFVLDSTHVSGYPYVQLFYHIKYELIPNFSLVSKIVILRNHGFKFALAVTQSNVFQPMDLDVARMTTYSYQFAFAQADGSTSNPSQPFYVYVP